jgi:hypothetical protein
MWSIKMNPNDLVAINYEESGFPSSFLAFKPLVFRDGQIYCCLLGPNPQEGIFGFGNSVDYAISNWDLEFKKRLIKNPKKDPTVQFIAYKIRMYKRLQTF